MSNKAPGNLVSVRIRVRKGVACATIAVVALQFLAEPELGDQLWAGLAIAALTFILVRLIITKLTPSAPEVFLRHPDVFMPLGVFTVVAYLLRVLFPGPLASLRFSAPVYVLLEIAMVGWTTSILTNAILDDDSDPLRALRSRRWFAKTFAVFFVGQSVPIFLILSQVLVSRSRFVVPVAVGLAWNVFTAALVPVAIASDEPFFQSLRTGFRVSFRMRTYWMKLVLLQWVVLGGFAYSRLSFENEGATNAKSLWDVSVYWAGGYPRTSNWYAVMLNAYDKRPSPGLTTVLALTLGVLSIAIKIFVIQSLRNVQRRESIEAADFKHRAAARSVD
jgi:hypothetical protein